MNPILERLSRSWQLFLRSIRVIRDHPKLLAFPIVTGILTAWIALFFLAPVALVFVAPHWLHGTRLQAIAESVGILRIHHGARFNFQVAPVGSAILAGIYLLNMFLATLSSVAFSNEILEALSGRSVSLSRGIGVACRRWKSVLVWSLFAGLIGLVIRALEERWAFFGRLVAGLIGLAWSAASIFSIPILVREPAIFDPLAILTKSATAIKRTWGEMLAGYVGMRGTHMLVVWLSVLFWLTAGVTAYLFANPWILLLVGLPWLFSLIAYSYLASVASQVYLCALYLYAFNGTAPDPYDPSMMNMAWKPKKN
jgi:hypothetical protein